MTKKRILVSLTALCFVVVLSMFTLLHAYPEFKYSQNVKKCNGNEPILLGKNTVFSTQYYYLPSHPSYDLYAKNNPGAIVEIIDYVCSKEDIPKQYSEDS